MSAASYGHPSSSSASSFGPPAQESGKNTLSTELNRGKKQGPSDRTPSPSDNATTATTSRVPRSNGIVDSLEKAKQRQNTSGGFLLGLPNGQRDKLFAKTVAGVSPKDSKSKDKATSNASRSISYTTPTRGPVHGSKPAAGSSPLSTELINQKVKDDEGGTNLRYPPNVTVGEAKSSTSLDFSDDEAVTGQVLRPHHVLPTFDTDPTQIVNLALNLSENRRRQLSTSRLSPMDPITNRRIMSTGSSGMAYPATLVAHRHPIQEKMITRNVSPRLDKSRKSRGEAELKQDHQRSLADAPIIRGLEFDFLDNSSFTPSEATLLRAEKARNIFELSYEFRRALQYLPKLPRAQESRPSTGRGQLKQPLSKTSGREYNPLQYIRNRKVRVRERKTFDSEGDGWKDINAVREWVSTLAVDRKAQITRSDNQSALPEFNGLVGNTSLGSSSLSTTLQRGPVPSVPKASRPRMDWMVTPWDLLADAYWLDQDDHNLLAEDRNGNKLFAQEPQLHSSPNTRAGTRSLPRRSASIPRPLSSLEDPSLVDAVHSETTNERGRRRHQKQDSITQVHEISSSRDRKGRWPRRLIRSPSSSSSEMSGSGSIRGLAKSRRPTSRERQDSVLLEKQVLDLLAQEADNLEWGSSKNYDSIAGNIDQRDPDDENGARNETGLAQKVRVEDSPNRRAKPSLSRISTRSEDLRDSTEEFRTILPTKSSAVPSISIDLPPTRSQSVSSSRRKQLANAPLNTTIQQKNENIDEVDFATGDRAHTIGLPDASIVESTDDHFLGTRLSSKATEHVGYLRRKRSDIKQPKAEKDQKHLDFRLRNLLKGSRFPDLVSSPVSKVGDLIRRKDPSEVSILQSSASSTQSDSDNAGTIAADRYTDAPSQRFADTSLDDIQALGHEDHAKYHIANLPVFKLPFKNDGNGPAAVNFDHISQQQRQLRNPGSTSRFRRLAPPELDMKSVSPPASPPRSSANDNVFSTPERKNRTLVESNDQNYQVGRRFAVTNLSPGTPSEQAHSASSLSGGLISNGLTPFKQIIPFVQGTVSRRDVARTSALLTASAILAKTTLCRATNAKVSARAFPKVSTPQGQAPTRTQGHIDAGNLLVDIIGKNNQAIRSLAESLSREVVNGLHDQIKRIDDTISSDLTSLVRRSADEVDRLGNELSTNYTLDVKRLNDSIDLIMRRKRRRLRWIRRGGYLLLEWTLLGLMWWVWLIVVIYRTGRGLIKGVYLTVKWLLWL